MTDRPHVSPWRKLSSITLLSWLFVLPASVPAQDTISATAGSADPLRLAAEDTASCREWSDPDVRLACFDAAALRLANALGSMDHAGHNAGELPIGPDAPDGPDAAAASDAPDAPTAPATVEPSGEAAEHPPDWAAAPQPREIEDARSTIDVWQRHYNHVRPHRSLGKKPPAVFAKEAA